MNKRFFVPLARCPAKGMGTRPVCKIRERADVAWPTFAKPERGPRAFLPGTPVSESQALRLDLHRGTSPPHSHRQNERVAIDYETTPLCGGPRPGTRASLARPTAQKREAALTTTASAAISKRLFVIKASLRGSLSRIRQSNKTHDGAECRDDHKNVEEGEQVENQTIVFRQQAKTQCYELQVVQDRLTAAKENQRADGPKACAREAQHRRNQPRYCPQHQHAQHHRSKISGFSENCVCLREHYNRCDHQGIISV